MYPGTRAVPGEVKRRPGLSPPTKKTHSHFLALISAKLVHYVILKEQLPDVEFFTVLVQFPQAMLLSRGHREGPLHI